jgi:hypothetical protein
MATFLPHPPPGTTLACAGAAAAVCGALFGGLFGLFDSRAQQQPWLAATPAAQQLAASCDVERDRRARSDCMTRIAQTMRARDARGTQLAHR